MRACLDEIHPATYGSGRILSARLLKAKKLFPGRALDGGEFSFDLKDSAGELIETKTNDVNGGITFTPIQYTVENEGQTYTYYISEESGEDENIVYDDTIYKVTVDIADNGQGTMVANVSYPDGDIPEFVNEYNSHSLTINKTVLGSMGERDKQFEFVLELTSDRLEGRTLTIRKVRQKVRQR